MGIRDYLTDFVHLFFPNLCKACNQSLFAHEEVLCTNCMYHLPLTDFHLDNRNETTQQLWAKTTFEFAVSMLYLSKSSRVEEMLYKLKYKKQPEIGRYLGKYYGDILTPLIQLHKVDAIIPIPIHPKKLRIRGYNQSACFAEGLSIQLGIPIIDNCLIRTKHTESQTTKSRAERYDNVMEVFTCVSKDQIVGEHILLVDDILTTGATICVASNILVQAGAKVSIATIARA